MLEPMVTKSLSERTRERRVVSSASNDPVATGSNQKSSRPVPWPAVTVLPERGTCMTTSFVMRSALGPGVDQLPRTDDFASRNCTVSVPPDFTDSLPVMGRKLPWPLRTRTCSMTQRAGAPTSMSMSTVSMVTSSLPFMSSQATYEPATASAASGTV